MDDFVLIKSAFGVITTFWSNFALETKFEHVQLREVISSHSKVHWC